MLLPYELLFFSDESSFHIVFAAIVLFVFGSTPNVLTSFPRSASDNRIKNFLPFGSAVVDIERGQFSDIKPWPWQTDTSVALNSWCYTPNNNYRLAEDIVCDLVDIVSKNGRLLLNIGPKADGTIPKEDADILNSIGNWLKRNGEAIYGVKVWRNYGEGPTQVIEGQFSDGIKKEFTSQDIRYTIKGSNIYGTVLKPNETGTYNFTAMADADASHKPVFHGIIKGVELLGCDNPVDWKRDEDGLHLSVQQSERKYPIVFKVIVD